MARWAPILGGVAGLGVALLAWRALARARRRPGIPDTDENREWLVRLLWAEQAFGGVPAGRLSQENVDEWAAIAWVALNRAESPAWAGDSVRAVVDSSGWWGTSPPDRLRTSWSTLASWRHFHEAVLLVDRIFAGWVPRLIGDRDHWIHPAAFPACAGGPGTEASGRSLCAETQFGVRRIPRWSVSVDEGGTSVRAPLAVGTARASGGGRA